MGECDGEGATSAMMLSSFCAIGESLGILELISVVKMIEQGAMWQDENEALPGCSNVVASMIVSDTELAKAIPW